ncbi:protein bark beetle [Halyomorpha halys]|uniref:protein bark beetle n=1 Tax=Halyomorpha halys TaxID=286706 RepID=UPI0006D5165E
MELRTHRIIWMILPVLLFGGAFSFTTESNELYSSETSTSPVDLPSGLLSDRTLRLEKGSYVLRDDMIVDHNSKLIIEPGVVIGFAPMVGITVRGVMTAVGKEHERISLGSINQPTSEALTRELRLVDGSSTRSGRLQVFQNGHWRSVCSNSRRWSVANIEVACRQMGWEGGKWLGWLDKEPGHKPRVLLQLNCSGTETDIRQCEKLPRRMGGPTCDYHPDIHIECFPQHVTSKVTNNWRGIRFENALYSRYLTLDNTLYVPTSHSRLEYVDIVNAGSGRGYNATSSLEIVGVAPQISSIKITDSAYTGINITDPRGPVNILNSTVSNNHGYGIFVNSSDGGVVIGATLVSENEGDGIKYVSHEHWPKNRRDIQDLCTLPTTAQQTFPMTVALQQSVYSVAAKECQKYFFTNPGYKLTVNFLPIQTDRNGSCTVQIHDGISSQDRVLASFPLFNSTKVQSITSSGHNIFISFFAEDSTDTYALIRITSGRDKWVDLNVTDSTVADNKGVGISIENLRSRLNIQRSSVSHSDHIAGVHVKNGAGQVNISDSRIAFNIGDGVNITYAGGSTNISRSSLSSNLGHGAAVWYNKTKEKEHIAFNHSVVLEYSEVFKNLEKGILVGNFCLDSTINVTGNWFNLSLNTAVEVETCLKPSSKLLKLYIGHNIFVQNKRPGVKVRPAVNLDAIIEFNKFKENTYGGILIKNDPSELYGILPSTVLIKNNEFYNNQGIYVVNVGLSPYSEQQHLLFTWNFIKDNKIKEPFNNNGETKVLTPRSRVAAPIVISSENAEVFRNIIQNPDSEYEIGVHLQDQSQTINCSYNWLGFGDEEKIYNRLFDRKDRYNLAKIQYIPFLLHRSNPGATTIMNYQRYVPQFYITTGNSVGGEVDGMENLRSGEYNVVRDINVRPGGRLILEPGVTLRFPPGIGMMVAGYLEARGRGPNDILLSLKEELPIEESTTLEENSDAPLTPAKPEPKIRLIGGTTSYEGTLQVQIDSKWGTVCNHRWTERAASLVCKQLGLVLNPDDWLLYLSDIPHPGTNDPILLTNVECDDDDLDITECKSQKASEFEHSCTHIQDVVMRCYPPSWAGVRLGVLAERSHLQYITIQNAGLLDYETSEFKPALQVDLARHTLESIRLTDNAHDGLGVVYSDIFSSGSANVVKNCEFSDNRGSGVSFKQAGLKISGSKIENNRISGIRHNPVLSALQQREIAGWFKPFSDLAAQYKPYNPIYIPSADKTIEIEEGSTKYIISQRVVTDAIQNTYYIKCNPGFVLGIQLLNPILNRSTESIIIHDAPDLNTHAVNWDLSRDLNVFPVTSSSYGIVLQYNSGVNALGTAVIAFSAFRGQQYVLLNRIFKGPIPTLYVHNSRIKGNTRGIWASYYNRYITEVGEHYLRKSNESIQVIGCDISHNKGEAVLVDAPHWSVTPSNISEITIIFNSTLITDNGRGFFQFSRDLRNSTNLFHWSLNDNSIERNLYGGFEINLPYVWQYNENYTHSVSIRNNTWRNNRNFGIMIGGHFSRVNFTDSIFEENVCRSGLISFQGMEKTLKIRNNIIQKNKGIFMIEFKADSQSEIMGDLNANFMYNLVKQNEPPTPETPSSVILFNGVQKVKIKRNLISENALGYAVVAGVRTARLDSTIDITENWWGTKDLVAIKQQIFDFDDWNDHAIAEYLPFLIEDSFDGSISTSWEPPTTMDIDSLSGRLTSSLTIYARDQPYKVVSDLTVMPEASLVLMPGVVLEFVPRVGILVLGRLEARGTRNREVIMRPASSFSSNRGLPIVEQTVRLCTPDNCTGNEGFVERWNATTQQWVPVCDERFSERNAQVTCRQMLRDGLDVFVSHGRRYELHHSDTSRIWSWHEPLQCTGDELRLEDCEIRLNGQVYGHVHRCNWDSEFVFVHCGQPIKQYNNWGGIRFANSDFEQSDFENRIHDAVTHTTLTKRESILEFVNITGAGLLHSQKSPAILSISRSPEINNVNLTQSVDHGISLISPTENVKLLFNWVQNNLGVGISISSITGEGRESDESSFSPLKEVLLPYRAFSLIDMCDPAKELFVQERVILYYVYDNRPINCVKIFYSSLRLKPFGFRLLQFNLYNSTDRLDLFDGGLYNRSIKHLTSLDFNSQGGLDKKLYKTQSSSLSIRLVASAASRSYGFIAEIVTLPISAIGFNRDVQHNISYSLISHNKGGGIHYVSAGEVNPRITLEYNQIRDNGLKMYGNFTTCTAAIYMDLQNTQNLHFRNNLVKSNQGGINIQADSRGSATALKGWIHNNLFTDNQNLPALYVEGRQSSPYQQVTIYNNFWTRNIAKYHNTIELLQVVSNFTLNYLYENVGAQILEVSGFDRVRLPIYQSTSHNSFYWNHGVERDSKSTIVAGTAGQQYVDNIFFNPDNDYEMITVNRSLFDVWQTPVNAKVNYWGFNTTLSVMGRIKDRSDQPNLLEVEFLPFLMNNASLLDGKCPPAWNLVGDTCYIYVGAPMTFYEAREFCKFANASLPYVMGNYIEVYKFLKKQQETYQFYDRVWIQHIDRINQCTAFMFQRIEIDNCNRMSPFICEMDPKVVIDVLSWRYDVVAVAMMGSVFIAILLVALVAGFWYSKSRQRQAQRLERRASIRQSLHSLRSFGSSHAFSDAYKRGISASIQPSPTLNKSSDYKKMAGSLDSIEKSQFNSSNEEETQSYDIYEAHNPAATEAINQGFDLSYRNQGFKDNSTFTSRENSTWHSTEDYMNNSSTLPLTTSLAMTDSTMDMGKSDYQQEPEYQEYYVRPKSSALLETNLDDTLPLAPTRSHSETLLDSGHPNHHYNGQDMSTFQPLSKSQPLETAM